MKPIAFALRELDQEAAIALGKCSFPVGSFQKRHAREMSERTKRAFPAASGSEIILLWLLCYQYRRQIGNPEVKAEAMAFKEMPIWYRLTAEQKVQYITAVSEACEMNVPISKAPTFQLLHPQPTAHQLELKAEKKKAGTQPYARKLIL